MDKGISQAVKQVPKAGRREPSVMSSAVGLYGLGEKMKPVSS